MKAQNSKSQALKSASLLLCVFAFCLLFRSYAADRKPNFLFVYTDDQRYDAMSVVQREQGERGRFPWFQTPNMDRIAAEGMRFRNAFVTLSLCAPSRTAFLTGRYNHLNGVASREKRDRKSTRLNSSHIPLSRM